MSSLSVNSASAGAPITVSGLASGLDTSAIISALMGVERQPVTRMTNEQGRLNAQQKTLQNIQSNLQQLSFSASEFSLGALFETSQAVTSSEPTRVSATTTTGAGIGGHEVEVSQLANSAQRTFAFTSPAAEETITIDGHAFTIKAGATAKELASAINSESSATVYAAVLDSATIVFSSRATGNTGSEFINVSDPGGALSEKAGSAKQGKDAEYKVDGVAGTATSNTVTNAIAGVTLSLNGLTTTGPVTINVAAPGPSVTGVEAQVQSFIKLYNSTVAEIDKELATKPPVQPQSAGEFATGTLFGDNQLLSLLTSMRQTMYEPISGLPAAMSSLSQLGISTGASGGGASSQASIAGQLTLNASKLTSAISENPAEVEQLLQRWSQSMQGLLNNASEPGGALDVRITGDGTQVKQLSSQISNLNELLALREKALQATYAQLEGVISINNSQSAWLTSQTASLARSGL
jgi:flagellar hook-associated protein 2